MKLPNGFGTVYELSGTRRRPFVVKKTISGKQKPLGYFATYQEALSFLVAYNKNPNFYGVDITFSRIYSLFRDEHFPTITEATRNSYKAAYKHCSALYDKQFRNIRLSDLQQVIKTARLHDCHYATQKKIRNLFHMMYNYAMKYDITDKDYSLFVIVEKDTKRKERVPFTLRQMRKIARLNSFSSNIILSLIYLGVRPTELLHLQTKDINYKQNYVIIRESKTKAGRNRVIPIHKSISDFIYSRKDFKYLIGGVNPKASITLAL